MFLSCEAVYFVSDGLAIKIGHSSRDLPHRIQELQTGNPRPLKLIGVIPCAVGCSYNKEQEIHLKLKEYQTIGGGTEWFSDVPEVHLEYKREIYNHELFTSFNDYIANIRKFTTGINNHIYSWVSTNLVPLFNDNRTIVVIAPPKSGKRIMAQSCVLQHPFAKHIFITAQNKKDIKPQSKEHKSMGLVYISATNLSKESDRIFEHLKKELNNYNGEIIIHFDECDFGSEKSKNINTKSVYNRLQEIIETRTNVKYISYSATPEEAVFSNPDQTLVYVPPSTYVGPIHYSNTALEAEKFFIVEGNDFNFSRQGVEALKFLNNSTKQFGVVRVSYNENQKQLHSLLKENYELLVERIKDLGLGITPIFIDQNNSEEHPWFYKEKDSVGNSKTGLWNSYQGKYLFIINKVAERGTEIGFHPLIAFWHDYTPKNTSYATAGQRIGRVFYYKSYYNEEFNSNYDACDFKNEEPNIRLYCNINVLKTMSEAYSAKNGEEFKLIWSEAELDRPIGNSRRIKADLTEKFGVEIEVEVYNSKEEAKKAAEKYYGSDPEWKSNLRYIRRISTQRSKSHDYVLAVLNNRLATTRAVAWHFDALSNVATDKQKESWEHCKIIHPEFIGKFLVLVKKSPQPIIKNSKIYSTSDKSLHYQNGIN